MTIYGPVIYSWCRSWMPRESPEDLTSDILCHLFQKIHLYRHIPGVRFSSWLKRVARNLVLAENPNDRPKTLTNIDVGELADGRALEDLDNRIDIASTPEWDIAQEVVTAVRGRLRDDRIWQAFYNVEILGRPIDEVARELGSTPQQVRLDRHRICERLKACWASHTANDSPPSNGKHTSNNGDSQ